MYKYKNGYGDGTNHGNGYGASNYNIHFGQSYITCGDGTRLNFNDFWNDRTGYGDGYRFQSFHGYPYYMLVKDITYVQIPTVY